jgi:DNA sulfur modification protein DndB
VKFNEIPIPAARGVQAGCEYYLAMLPIRSAAQLFKVDYFNLPPEERSQRVPDPQRVETLAKWISENPNDYVLPALTGSIEGELEFKPCPGNPRVGLLVVDLGAIWHLLDGQHRKEALRKASENEAIANEAIAVTLFADRGLEWRQRAFAKINLYAKPPSKS